MKLTAARVTQFVIAGHTIPEMDGLAAAFGADRSAYPAMNSLPEKYQRGQANGCKVFSALFFGGGKLADHGLELNAGVDAKAFLTTLRALMSSFAPNQELKEATCGLLIDTYTHKIGGVA